MYIDELIESILIGSELKDKVFSFGELKYRSYNSFKSTLSLPGRNSNYEFSSERTPFPKLNPNTSSRDIGKIIHFFANHELLAIELLAYALMKFPDSDISFKKMIVQTIREEQYHFNLYQNRLKELGISFGDFPVNGNFWHLLEKVQNPNEFVCGMNLTFEQANLDFALEFKKKFREIGDKKTSEILNIVLEDEVSHVSRGVYYLKKCNTKSLSLWQNYLANLPFYISPVKGKGSLFSEEYRKKSNLDDEFIKQIKVYQESHSRKAQIYWYNPDCELEFLFEDFNKLYKRSNQNKDRISDTSFLMNYLSTKKDILLVPVKPSLSFLHYLDKHKIEIAYSLEYEESSSEILLNNLKYLKRNIKGSHSFIPWGGSTKAFDMAKTLTKIVNKNEISGTIKIPLGHKSKRWFSKLELPSIRKSFQDNLKYNDSKLYESRSIGTIINQISDLEREIDFHENLFIKTDYSSAGSGCHLVSNNLESNGTKFEFIHKLFRQGKKVLCEPYFEKVSDYSALGRVYNSEVYFDHFSQFITSKNGQYQAHILSSFYGDLGVNNLSDEYKAEAKKALKFCGSYLMASGFEGSFGVDFFTYKSNLDSRIFLQPICEINSRFTMGHIAVRLSSYIKSSEKALLGFIKLKNIITLGFKGGQDFYSKISEKFPVEMKNKKISSGMLFITDWETAKFCIGVVSIGEESCDYLSEIIGV